MLGDSSPAGQVCPSRPGVDAFGYMSAIAACGRPAVIRAYMGLEQDTLTGDTTSCKGMASVTVMRSSAGGRPGKTESHRTLGGCHPRLLGTVWARERGRRRIASLPVKGRGFRGGVTLSCWSCPNPFLSTSFLLLLECRSTWYSRPSGCTPAPHNVVEYAL